MDQPGAIAIVGYGLIGGSLAQCLLEKRMHGQLRVWDPSPAARSVALRRLGRDAVAESLHAAVRTSDLVVIAAPVFSFPRVLADVCLSAPSQAVLTDVGSVKAGVVAEVRKAGPEVSARFVPGHPIAGAEKSGPEHSNARLFAGRKVVLTPLEETEPRALRAVESLWTNCAARVVRMSPAAHDEVFGFVSHLPHLLAFAYLAGDPGAEAASRTRFAGPGFRDFTRIAGANPALWAQICVANGAVVLEELGRFSERLESIRGYLAEGATPALEALFAGAQKARAAFDVQLEKEAVQP